MTNEQALHFLREADILLGSDVEGANRREDTLDQVKTLVSAALAVLQGDATENQLQEAAGALHASSRHYAALDGE